MPRRTVLSASQRILFETLPTAPADLAKYYLLSDEELTLVQERRRAENRLGFALQLCLVRYPGRLLRANEQPPQALIAFVAEQVGADSGIFSEYAKRDETRWEHALLLIRRLGLSTFTGQHLREVVPWLVPIAVENPKGTVLVRAVLNELRHRRILLHPDLAVVERLVATTMGRAERRVFNQINESLSDTQHTRFDRWLIPEVDKTQSRFSWVRQPAGKPCLANGLAIIERLQAIEALKSPVAVVETLPLGRRQLLSREGKRESTLGLGLGLRTLT